MNTVSIPVTVTPNSNGTTTFSISQWSYTTAPIVQLTPLTISANLSNGIIGTPYSGSIVCSGGDGNYDITSSSLPTGLTLNANSGAITGTPTEVFANSVEFVVSDSSNTTPANVTVQFVITSPAVMSVTLTGTLSNGVAINVTAQQGQRVPLIANNTSAGSLMFYADGMCARIENAYMGTLDDLIGTFHLIAGETVLFDGPLTVWAYSCTRPFWIKQPSINSNPDLSLFPAYSSAPNASLSKKYASSNNGPMGWGYDEVSIGNAGESARLGPVPEGDADWIANPTPDNAVVIRGMADASSVWPYHVIDPLTNKMVDLTKYPNASLLSACFGPKNPILKYTTTCPLNLGQAQGHATNRNALACVTFNTDYDKEELSLWCNYVNGLWQNPAYRLPPGCCNSSHGELPRSIGRGLVVMLYAAKLSDSTAYFDAWVNAYAADLNTRLLAQTGIHIDQLGIVYPNSGFAPWQNHIAIYGMGLAVKLGYTAYQPILDYMAVTLLDSMLNAQHELSTLYSVSVKDATGNLAPDWVTALKDDATVLPNTVGVALTCAEGSQALRTAMAQPDAMNPGDFDGHPTSATGYAAMMQPALAMLASHGTDQVRAQAAWTKFKQYMRIDFSSNPKYNVIP